MELNSRFSVQKKSLTPKTASSSLPSSPSPSPSIIAENISDENCGICHHVVTDNDKALICDRCEKWIHTKCTKMPDIKYEHHIINYEDTFECRNCRTCGICDKIIASNHKFVDCNTCRKYVHIKCNKFDEKQYDRYKKDKNPTFCLKCNEENLPFLNLSDKQHSLTMDGINYPEETDVDNLFLSEPQMRIINIK